MGAFGPYPRDTAMSIDNTIIISINFTIAIVYAIAYSIDIISSIGIAYSNIITQAGHIHTYDSGARTTLFF